MPWMVAVSLNRKSRIKNEGDRVCAHHRFEPVDGPLLRLERVF